MKRGVGRLGIPHGALSLLTLKIIHLERKDPYVTPSPTSAGSAGMV